MQLVKISDVHITTSMFSQQGSQDVGEIILLSDNYT